MRVRRHSLVAAVVAAMALMVGAGAAQAVFPDFTGCTSRVPATEGICVNIQQRSGNFNIGGFNVPLHETLEIRGTLIANETETPTFRPPTGSTGFISRAERVPGGLIGIEWLPGNSVLAITELAGPSSAIRINLTRFSVELPIKVRLVNLLLGMDCHIGNNSNPVRLTLVTETTSPPPPNTPISGERGTFEPMAGGFKVIGNTSVENSFRVPGATECGLGLGLPSAAGRNSISLRNDLALGVVP